jgi:hypothetical protein
MEPISAVGPVVVVLARFGSARGLYTTTTGADMQYVTQIHISILRIEEWRKNVSDHS